MRPPTGPPIVVYQMGKVGSSAVTRSLRALDLRRDVHQVHLLHDLDAIEADVRATYPDPSGTLDLIARGRRIRADLEASSVPWSVITLVRDPVQRNVSGFFQNLTRFAPDAYERAGRDALPTAELGDLFLTRYEHDASLAWFPSQLQPVFDVDVFATPFPAERGYATYESARAHVLLVRLEDLQERGAAAIRDFLGLDRFALVPANVASTKPYADLYERFLAEVDLPSEYLDRMYASANARHFYTDDELAGFRRRWSRAAP